MVIRILILLQLIQYILQLILSYFQVDGLHGLCLVLGLVHRLGLLALLGRVVASGSFEVDLTMGEIARLSVLAHVVSTEVLT